MYILYIYICILVSVDDGFFFLYVFRSFEIKYELDNFQTTKKKPNPNAFES